MSLRRTACFFRSAGVGAESSDEGLRGGRHRGKGPCPLFFVSCFRCLALSPLSVSLLHKKKKKKMCVGDRRAGAEQYSIAWQDQQ